MGLSAAVEVGAGNGFSCARRAGGTIACWGAGSFGALGNGAFARSPVTVNVLGIADAVELSVGSNHACARHAGGTVSCWGEGGEGALGDGGGVRSPVPVFAVGIDDAIAVAAEGGLPDNSIANDVTCAVRAGGSVWCWGRGYGATPVLAFDDAVVVAVAAGIDHVCAVGADGTLACAGANKYGQLGDGTTIDHQTLRPVALAGVAGVAAGSETTCARTTSGAVWCWGLDENGGVGSETPAIQSTPAPMVGAAAPAVASGRDQTCVIAAGAVYCVGNDAWGALGNGTPERDESSLVRVVTPGVAAEIGVADRHACARDTSGGVSCWGLSDYGELGSNASIHNPTPIAVPGVNAAELGVGSHHVCAVTVSGSVLCWGYDWYGQLGDCASACCMTGAPMTSTPVAVPGIAAATHVCGGSKHACAVLSSGAVWCWGSGSNGQLGNGSSCSSSPPVQVTSITDAVDVACSETATCALHASGAVSCWGDVGRVGTVGSGTWFPVAVAGIASASELVIGDTHGCVREGTQVRCWGANAFGQLGDGGFAARTDALAVPGLPAIATIGTGDQNTCAVGADASVWCWGSDSHRQLGTGAPIAHTALARVALPCP